jgi:hypothetical protein
MDLYQWNVLYYIYKQKIYIKLGSIIIEPKIEDKK